MTVIVPTILGWLLDSDPWIRWQVMLPAPSQPAIDEAGGRRSGPRPSPRWHYDLDLRFCKGDDEHCINGRVVAIGVPVGQRVPQPTSR